MGNEDEKVAKIRRLKKVSFEDGRLVPAGEIKEMVPEKKPKPLGRPKGSLPTCGICGKKGHTRRTCNRQKGKSGSIAADYIKKEIGNGGDI